MVVGGSTATAVWWWGVDGDEAKVLTVKVRCRPVTTRLLVHLWPLLGVSHTKVAVHRAKSGGEPPHAGFDPRPVRRICKKERQKPLEPIGID